MAAAGKGQDLDVLPRLDQVIDHREGVGKVHVVIACTVSDEQLPLQVGGIFHRRRFLIAHLVFLREPHVAFRVDGVVIAPVGDRATGKSRFEVAARLEHGMQRHVAAVTPSPDADAIGFHVGKSSQICHSVALVGKFLSAQAKMDGLFEKMAAAR